MPEPKKRAVKRTDAQRAAENKYKKAKQKKIQCNFFPPDYDLYEFARNREERHVVIPEAPHSRGQGKKRERLAMKLALDFLIFVSELVMLVCAIALVVIAVKLVFSLAKEAVSARFPKAAKFVEKNYRYWLIAIFVVLFCSGGSALLLLLLVIL